MTASPNPCGLALDSWCRRHPVPSARVAVAFSGGADSTALLLAACARWPDGVVALHVHHGLQAAADGFEQLAADVCARLGIAFLSTRVNAAHGIGQSPEDAARRARYRALADLAQEAGAGLVLLGQHADDQAESVLLALSRGAGLAGLAGMADIFERHGTVFARPLLDLQARALRVWLERNGHTFVDDPSNADTRFTRNRMRATLTPAWEACFPGFRTAIARSARHAAQAQCLLEELATADLATVGVPPRISALQLLGRARQGNALRHWLKSDAGGAPSEAQLAELLDQIGACRTRGHAIHIKVAAGHVCRYGEVLRYDPSI